MPETRSETPGEKTMRRFYEGKLAERMMQAGSLHLNRQLLRRGAVKQQDGTLGEKDDTTPTSLGDDMQIRIGDEVNYYQETAPEPLPSTQPAAEKSLVSRALPYLLAGALGAGGLGGADYLLGLLNRPPAAVEPPASIAPPGYGDLPGYGLKIGRPGGIAGEQDVSPF